MSEPEQGKRSLSQLHLSTALLLMVSSGIILGALMYYARAPILIPDEFTQEPNAVENIVVRVNGLRAVTILVFVPLMGLLLLIVGTICERLIRRREGRKT